MFPLEGTRYLPFAVRTVTTSNLHQLSPDHYRASLERIPMRPVLLCILLVCGSAIPASAQQLKEITNSIGTKLVLIHAGSFTMGSPVSEVGRQDNETPHEVTISKSYYLGAYEVTQEQYGQVMEENPSLFLGSQLPVEQVNWDDSVSYCKKLSDLREEKDAGRVYRLPTEAEWEYACRSTSGAAYSFGDTSDALAEYSWFSDSNEKNPAIQLNSKTHPVGEKKSNRWGLFDMHGNVSEWCHDRFADYPAGESTDPQGPEQGLSRVYRGGSWLDVYGNCRSARRGSGNPLKRTFVNGFRVAMSLPIKQRESASSK